MVRIVVFVLSGTLLFFGCKKEEIIGFTNHADNSTVSAQLNGEDWFASGASGISINRRDSFDTGFFVTKDGFLRASLNFQAIPLKLGRHSISTQLEPQSQNEFAVSYADYGTFLSDGDVIGEIWDSTTDSLYNFCIVDKIDTLNNVLEGRFQLMLVKDPTRRLFDTPDTMRFENGRFSAEIRY